MTVIRRDGLQWVAPRDGLAHATVNSELRALCGAMPTADRYAWPIREFCVLCLTLEDGRRAEKGREIRSRSRVA
jgi:hypothetical protein